MTTLNSVVSLQDRSAGDPVRGHLAAGLLVDEDLVLVPTPPVHVGPEGRSFDAVVMPVGGDAVERIAPRRVALLRFDARRKPTRKTPPVLAYVQLAEPSGLPRPVFGDFTAAELYGALWRHGDYWRALVEVGAIPEEVPPIVSDLLERIPVAPAGTVDAEPTWHFQLYDNADELAARSCPPPLSCHGRRVFGDG